MSYIPCCVRTAFFKCLGDMDDSNSQTFACGYFSHSQIIKITRVLRISSPGTWLFKGQYLIGGFIDSPATLSTFVTTSKTNVFLKKLKGVSALTSDWRAKRRKIFPVGDDFQVKYTRLMSIPMFNALVQSQHNVNGPVRKVCMLLVNFVLALVNLFRELIIFFSSISQPISKFH